MMSMGAYRLPWIGSSEMLLESTHSCRLAAINRCLCAIRPLFRQLVTNSPRSRADAATCADAETAHSWGQQRPWRLRAS